MHRSTHSRGIITEKDNISVPKHIGAHGPHRRDNGKQFQDIDMGLISLVAIRLLKQPRIACGVIPCLHQPSGAFRITHKPLTRGLIDHDDAQPVSGLAEARIRVDQDLVSGSLLETKLQRWHVPKEFAKETQHVSHTRSPSRARTFCCWSRAVCICSIHQRLSRRSAYPIIGRRQGEIQPTQQGCCLRGTKNALLSAFVHRCNNLPAHSNISLCSTHVHIHINNLRCPHTRTYTAIVDAAHTSA